MKIAFFHHLSLTYYAGGEKVLMELASGLMMRGHQVEIYALPLAKRRRNIPINEKLYYEKWLRRIMDVDSAYYVYAPMLCLILKTDAPKIAGIHSPMYATHLQHHEVQRLNILSFFRKFGILRTATRLYFSVNSRELDTYNAVHMVSPALKQVINHRQVYCIPNGVDIERYLPTEKRMKFTVLFVGRREWAKGFDIYEKTADMFSNVEDIEFSATGESIGKVRGLGFIREEDLPRIYGESHVLVYPTRIDLMSMAILEALASGTPVITTPIPSHSSHNLPVIYASTPKEIAEKILWLKNVYEHNPEKYYKFARQGRKAALDYDIRKTIKRFEVMLREVAKRD